jgi:curved DNA-binding protein CbpA
MELALATAVLGVRADAPFADVKAAYHAALRRLHPDVGGSGDPTALDLVRGAYAALRTGRGRKPEQPVRRPLVDVYA